MAKFYYQSTGDSPSEFVAKIDGYLCFIKPIIESGQIIWAWSIQSGGGWTHRGVADQVVEHKTGTAFSISMAEEAITNALDHCDF